MPLTKSQLSQIEEIIDRRFLAFMYTALGRRALTEREITKLTKAGLLRRGTKHMVSDAYSFGKLSALVGAKDARRSTYENVLGMIDKVPKTNIEKRAIEYATDHAGQYIRSLKDTMVRDLGALTARHSGAALRAVQSGVKEAIANRETVSELKTNLFNTFDNRYRDWQRVAHTEINTAIQQGVHQTIQDESEDGAEQLVFKRPNPDACKYCKAVYLREDGVTPKIFKLKDLEETNVGRKAANWGPTIGSVHPWCFPADHKVLTKRGNIPIQSIKPGDRVLTHKGHWKVVLDSLQRDWNGELITIQTKNQMIKSTPNHPFLIENNWVSASHLDEGDNLFEIFPFEIVFKKINNKPAMTRKVIKFIGVLNSFFGGRVPIATLDLNSHHPFKNRNINIVFKNSFQWLYFYSSLREFLNKFFFKIRQNTRFFSFFGSFNERVDRMFASFPFFSSFFGNRFSLVFARIFESKESGLTHSSGMQSHFNDSFSYCVSANFKPFANFKNRISGTKHLLERGLINVFAKHLYRPSAIVRKSKEKFEGKVYNLVVAEDNSYLCEGFVVHNCNCQLLTVPKGYDFEKRKVAAEPFRHGKKEYKTGEMIQDHEYKNLTEPQRENVGEDAVLTFTGKEAEPIRKSELISQDFENEECFCDHV